MGFILHQVCNSWKLTLFFLKYVLCSTYYNITGKVQSQHTFTI